MTLAPPTDEGPAGADATGQLIRLPVTTAVPAATAAATTAVTGASPPSRPRRPPARLDALRSVLEASERAARPRLAVVALASCALVVAVLLVAPPFKGLGNNGDFERVMYRVGLQHRDTGQEARAAAYANRSYRFLPGVHDPLRYNSSQMLIVRTALGAERLAGRGQYFDLRWLGMANLGFLLVGLGLIFRACRQFGSGPARPVALLLAAIAFTDVGYVVYLNSFYAEAAGLCFVLIMVGTAAAIPGSRRPLLVWAAFVAAACLLVASKPAYSIFALPLAVLAAVMTRWGRGGLRWLMALPGAALILAIGAWMYGQTPAELLRISIYNGVFNEIVPHAQNGRQALMDLGLSPSLAVYSGTKAFRPDSGFAKLHMQKDFFDRISAGDVFDYYLAHPDRLVGLLRRGAGDAFELRPPDLGNLERSESVRKVEYSPGAPWTLVHRRLLPHSLWFVVAVLGAAFVVGAAGVRRRPEQRPGSPEVLAALAVMAGMAFALPLVSEGDNELVKHMFMFNVLFDLCLIALVGVVVRSLLARRGSLHGRATSSARAGPVTGPLSSSEGQPPLLVGCGVPPLMRAAAPSTSSLRKRR